MPACKGRFTHAILGFRLGTVFFTTSAAVSYDLVAFFNEAPLIVESYLHSLLDYLTDRDQVLGDGGNM